ncbi:MAG: alpha-hydroxy-acid oxidizing protein [Deltaproteobacteria bacterium]|nr:alpha-hydroxy-acid oxidizing protein [Deltaproteobacteria bacterium]
MVAVADFEAYAQRHLPRPVLDYFRSGAGAEQTLAENERAFQAGPGEGGQRSRERGGDRSALAPLRAGLPAQRLRLRPRVLRDVRALSTATTVLGAPVASPVLVAPTAMQVSGEGGRCSLGLS